MPNDEHTNSEIETELRRIVAMKASYTEKSAAFINWLPQAVEAINARAQVPNPPPVQMQSEVGSLEWFADLRV